MANKTVHPPCGKRIKLTCVACGTGFECYASDRHGEEAACSNSCAARLREKRLGHGSVTLPCGWCGEICALYPITIVNHVNPYRIEGQKTGAFEVCDVLGDAPDFHALPVGNAGNITAYWKGYKEYHAAGKAQKFPKMLGFQAAGSAPIVDGAPVLRPQTIATAIRIGNPASWQHALDARDESGGVVDKVTDDEILEAYRLLPALEGVFAEPACAAPVAGLKKLYEAGYFRDYDGATVAVTLTGHGLKDPDRVIKTVPHPAAVPATLEAVVKALGF